MIGIAASNIGGRTLHSFAGIGFGTEPAHVLARKIIMEGNAFEGMDTSELMNHDASEGINAFERWTRTKVLIIDEGRENCLLFSVQMHSHLVSSIDD